MYLLIGATGFLGSYLVKELLTITDEKIVCVGRHFYGNVDNGKTSQIEQIICDITNKESVQNLNHQFKNQRKKIVFLAAYHNPDLVAKNWSTAWDVNIVALAGFLNVIENIESLFYISTDSVYGNSENNRHFCEEDMLNPVNEYGKQKRLAEELVLTYGYNVVRYPFLIGSSLLPNKKHFYDQLVDDLIHGKTIKMFGDSYRSSLDFDTAAKMLAQILMRYTEKCPKILNICGDQDLSKYDIGLLIAQKLQVDSELVEKISVEDSQTIFSAERAKSTLMSNEKLKKYLSLETVTIKI